MPEIKVERREVLDYRRKEFVDEILPTLTIKRAARHRGTGATTTVGSGRVAPGSTLLVTYLSIQSGSPELWWALTKEGTLAPDQVNGTVDVGYLESKGAETRRGNVKEPVTSLGPGTFRLRLLTPGTARWFGMAYEGVEL